MFHKVNPIFPRKKRPKLFKFDLLECHYLPDQWKTMVSCIMLNRTNRRQVDPVIEKFFERFKYPISCSNAHPDEVTPIIKPLGFQNRRALSLIRFSKYICEVNVLGAHNIKKAPGIGKYGEQAFRILFLGDRSISPDDHALKNFLEFENEPFSVCPYCFHEMKDQFGCHNCRWVVPRWYKRS